MNAFWLHSLAVATMAKRLAEYCDVPRNETADYFSAGLLHDIGKVVFALYMPTEYCAGFATGRAGGGAADRGRGTDHGMSIMRRSGLCWRRSGDSPRAWCRASPDTTAPFLKNPAFMLIACSRQIRPAKLWSTVFPASPMRKNCLHQCRSVFVWISSVSSVPCPRPYGGTGTRENFYQCLKRRGAVKVILRGVRGSIPTPGPENRPVRRQYHLHRGHYGCGRANYH